VNSTTATLTFQHYGQLGSCVDAIGTPEFPTRISEFCMEVSDASTVFLAAFFAQHKPIALFQNHTDINDKVALKLYLKRFQL
jgi:hypothetical protein